MLPLHISWKDETGSRIFRGANWDLDSWIVQDLFEGALAPGSYSAIQTVALQNTAQERRLEALARDGVSPSGLPEKMVSLRLYLDGDDATIATLIDAWPQQGAGIELSFDHGVSWKAISPLWGNPRDESTWIPLPVSALATGGVAGELGPFPPHNRATLQLRVKTPLNPSSFGLLRFQLAVDCDVL